jgi:hypothetical protein
MASIISAGTTSGTSLNLSGDTSGVLQLASNGSTTAVTIDTSQNVGIGTASPNAPLHVTRSTGGVTATFANTATSNQNANINAVSDNSTAISLRVFGSAAGSAGMLAANSTMLYTSAADLNILADNGSGVIKFATGGTTERMRIPAAGGVQSAGSISVGGATPTTSGAGITFPASQSASSDANTLDDYEEGTWTPTLTFSGGSIGITYTARTARYTKIGRLVYVFAAVTLSNKGSSSGAANVNNLPFSSITNAVPGEFFVTAGGASIGSGFSAVFGTEIYFYNQASTDRQNLNESNFTNTTEFSFSAVYEV